ncbi:MAG: AAA family ATPase [Sandaracinaceae bacterium]|jgi:ATP-dependent Clp protease ATP-binding subunit ClpC|nr:AAA family ATPase [Sandaracinaceae bacterium]
MSSPKPSLRVYFIAHPEGRWSGYLMRLRQGLFDQPAPSAYGFSREEVLQLIEQELTERIATGRETLDAYFFTETFSVGVARVVVRPATVVDKQTVVGERTIPMRISYAWSPLPSGGYRVMLPRFGWWILLETLTLAPDALRTAVGAALLGGQQSWVYDFDQQGDDDVQVFEPAELARSRSAPKRPSEGERLRADFPIATAVCDEWVQRCADGRLPRRSASPGALQQLTSLLELRPLPSILIVGEPGVGKTTLVQGFARELLRRRRASTGHEPRLWATSADRLIAGMIYLGEWQERCLGLIEELADERDFLYVDNLASFLKERSAGSSVGDLFAPAVLSSSLPIIAECSPSEREWARRHAATLLDAMDVVELAEMPSASVARLVVQRSAQSGQRDGRPGAVIHPEGVSRVVHHLSAFRRDQRFPGKAVHFLDWLDADEARPSVLYPADVSVAYARYSGLPIAVIADEHPVTTREVAAALRAGVIGQDAACEACARVVVPFKAGVHDPDKPLGSLFFVGPTGVGKTELAKQLAHYLFGDAKRLIRVDMSEYMVRGAAQRLLEVGEGVSSLAQRVRAQPLSLVLFDEIEKAHRETFDLLLGLLGEGRLTDSRGSLVDFRMTIVVMTSNLGVSERAAAGFGTSRQQDFARGVREHFRPEFWNRLDHVVSFGHLQREDVRRIVDLELGKVRAREGLRARGVALQVSSAARDRLADLGYDERRGARPLQRVIEERVVTPMAVHLAEAPELTGVTFRVACAGEPRPLLAGTVVDVELS